MAERRIIAETENIRVIAQDAPGQTVIVTFNELGSTFDGDRFWGDTFLEKQGFPGIGFMTSRPNWYPHDEMQQILPAVEREIAGRRVVTYGFSQGGYGALKFSRSLKASVVLSFSPQWSINPDDVGGVDDRYHQHYDRDLRNGERIILSDISGRVFLFFDRGEFADNINARWISDIGYPCHHVVMPFTGHGTVRLFSESRGASALLQACRISAPEPRHLRALVRSCRSKSRTYRDEMISQLLARLLKSENPEITRAAFLQAVIDQEPESRRFDRAILLHATDHQERANEIVELISIDELTNYNLMGAWHYSHRRNWSIAELKIADAILKIRTDNVLDRLHAVNTLLTYNQIGRAEEELESLSARPDILRFDHYFQFTGKIGRFDLMEGVVLNFAEKEKQSNMLSTLIDKYAHIMDRGSQFKWLLRLNEIGQDMPKLLEAVGDRFFAIEEISAALEARRTLLKMRPTDCDLKIKIIECISLRDPDEALLQLSRLLSYGNIFRTETWERIADIYARGGWRYRNDRLKALRTAITASPSNTSAFRSLIVELLSENQKGKAREELSRFQIDRNCNHWHVFEIGHLGIRLGVLEVARRCFDYVLLKNPENSGVLLERAKLSHLLGEDDEALVYLYDAVFGDKGNVGLDITQLEESCRLFDALDKSGVYTKAAAQRLLLRSPANQTAKVILSIAGIREAGRPQQAARRVAEQRRAGQGLLSFAAKIIRGVER